MIPFNYARAADAQSAIALHDRHSAFVAGGTNLLDLMKLHVEQPARLVDINSLPLIQIEERDGGLRIGALVRNSDLAYHPLVRSRYPLLSQSLLAGATPQLRNMATVGGNILQRTRCPYFRDTVFACNKREPGSGCAALHGYNRGHAVLGVSEHCIAVMPSDMCVALAALDAVVQTRGPSGERSIPFSGFHLRPEDHPERETVLEPGELIMAVDLPALPFAVHAHYLKLRDRASYSFALVSVGAMLDVAGGIIRDARLALGGVATTPWRAYEAEQALAGQPATEQSFRRAADIAMRDAKPFQYNAFKIELTRRAIVRALGAIGATHDSH